MTITKKPVSAATKKVISNAKSPNEAAPKKTYSEEEEDDLDLDDDVDMDDVDDIEFDDEDEEDEDY